MKRVHLSNGKMAMRRWMVTVFLVLAASLALAVRTEADAPQVGRTLAQGSQARTITYTYDEAGRLVQEDHSDGKIITYTYDASGNLLHMGPALVGDMDSDCDVDIVDIMLVASRWNSKIGDANYDSRYDLDSDGDIDIVDIMMVATHWNEHC